MFLAKQMPKIYTDIKLFFKKLSEQGHEVVFLWWNGEREEK